MEEQLVSIIVPVYNMAEVLNTSAKTFINQTYKNIEIIMIDDGSADDSLRVMQQLAAADTRIRVYHQENKEQPEREIQECHMRQVSITTFRTLMIESRKTPWKSLFLLLRIQGLIWRFADMNG